MLLYTVEHFKHELAVIMFHCLQGPFCQEVLHQDWFRAFWARNYDALTVVSVLRNVQMDVDKTRKWVHAQLKHGTSNPHFQVLKESCDALWEKRLKSEACLVDCLIEILFYEPADRSKYREDAMMQLVMDEPPGHLNFTVVSAMGVSRLNEYKDLPRFWGLPTWMKNKYAKYGIKQYQEHKLILTHTYII